MVTVFGLACVSVAEVAAVASPGGLHADHGRGLVISGQLADEGDHTHALALKWNARSTAPYEHEMRLCGGNHPCVDCGAVLIASDVAITAAHCFNWKPMTWSNAYYGAPNTASGSGWWLKVSAYNLREHDEDGVPGAHDDHCDGWIAVETVTRHEYYVQATDENDIALLFLKRPAPCAERQIVKLDYPRSTPNFWQGVYGWVIGWGDRSTTSWRSDYPYRKHEVSLPIMTNYECLEAYGNLLKGAETISSGMICTGSIHGKDACGGDSGGPLVSPYPEDGKPLLIGIVSWGIGCGRHPGVYTRVAYYRDWISRHSQIASPSPPAVSPPPPGPVPGTGTDLGIAVRCCSAREDGGEDCVVPEDCNALPYPASYNDAWRYCDARGHTLCDRSCSGTGCGYDLKPVIVGASVGGSLCLLACIGAITYALRKAIREPRVFDMQMERITGGLWPDNFAERHTVQGEEGDGLAEATEPVSKEQSITFRGQILPAASDGPRSQAV
ncbi:hypothetical protein EMIHUDRAFT_210744 [Emiliania huxleyi CCMP1516]|uniref:Peptidase S1 domain-containing protein n=2 Tax=Emiliania huxleyi TaxID=2903 RepID=A0A0D3IYM9_EMIH1|nr:hypothetical protein EMIHUDRAFT_210744 [Emiliania huxleyi CCMP1516]EOD16364.1 hypothetical protein EMIHUDRAFT_210744 [Emiliania huxleyi CCMP1516]|eukprot:XP_005768793.1 hypothetical protein EMIHUDRAFT_210744 [Emiliania huxleyi CCMP1516]